MRQEKVARLNSTEIPLDNLHYLVYKYYHSDLFDSLKQYAKGKLLDIGCGNKPYLPILKPYVDEYTGCDIVQSSDSCVDVICHANNIPLQSDLFDTVISTQTIEHVEDHQGLINEAYRLLKKDGIFIVSGPMYWPLHEEPHDFFRFTRYGFQYILEKAGFTILEYKSNGGKWALFGQVLNQTLYSGNDKIRGVRFRIIRRILNLFGGVRFINKVFGKMDDKHKDESNTMNYVFIGKK